MKHFPSLLIYVAMSIRSMQRWESFANERHWLNKEINTVNVLLVYYDQMHHSKVDGLSLHFAHEGVSVQRKLWVNSLLIIDS